MKMAVEEWINDNSYVSVNSDCWIIIGLGSYITLSWKYKEKLWPWISSDDLPFMCFSSLNQPHLDIELMVWWCACSLSDHCDFSFLFKYSFLLELWWWIWQFETLEPQRKIVVLTVQIKIFFFFFLIEQNKCPKQPVIYTGLGGFFLPYSVLLSVHRFARREAGYFGHAL